jgi:DNA modification methylase
MVTDPPYGVEYDASWRNEADRANGKPYGASAVGRVTNDDRADWREACELFPGQVAYVWHASLFGTTVQLSLEAAKFELRSQIIWAKDRFAISRGHYHWQHESCFYAVRLGSPAAWNGGWSQTTLWQIGHSKSETGHSTQKPVDCMRKPMENNSSPGQAVYDPFLGSGTSVIAAESIGRVCLGLELNPVYVDVIIERWQNYTGKKAVRESDGVEFDHAGTQTEADSAQADYGQPRQEAA